MMSIRSAKIRTKISFFILAIITILSSLFYHLRISDRSKSFEKEYFKQISEMEMKFESLTRSDEKVLSASLDIFVQNQSFIDTFLNQDRDLLYEKSLPIFNQLKKEYGITHFYYHSLNGINFLRIHNENLFGDKITRFTFKNAQETMDSSSGIELGKTAFALRVVEPYYNNNKLIGYVEFGREINHFIKELKEKTSNEFSIIVDKKFLDHDKWLSVRKVAGLRNNWDDFPTHLTIDSTIQNKSVLNNIMLQCFDNEKNSSSTHNFLKKYYEGGEVYLCGSFPIFDADNKNVGLVVSLIDVTDAVFLENSSNRNALLLSLLTSLLAFLSFYLVSSKIVIEPIQKLVGLVNSLSKGNYLARVRVKSKDELGLLSSAINKMADEILESQTNLESKVEEKTKSLSEKKQHLEDQQKAVLNILEDAEEERKKAINQTHELKKFKMAVSYASDHIVITDAEGIIVYANDAVERITGFNKKEILGTKVGDKKSWGGLMGKAFYKKFWKAIKEEKKVFTGELKNKRKDGRKYTALASVSPILNSKKEVVFFVGIERDITHEKEVDRMKTEFISLASHQLRTPLSAMNWFLEMLLDGDMGKLNKEQHKTISDIDKSNQRMISLVNGLLNISRMESGRIIIEPKLTNLAKLINDILLELKPKIKEKNIDLSVDLDSKIGEISVDPSLTAEVYRNLATNAIKYSKQDGTIKIILSKKGKYIVFEINDNGLGIPKKDQPKIFEKFHRAINARQAETDGTGLGLYLAKAIVNSSKGKIWFESEENKGSTFWFSLPASGVKAQKGEVRLDGHLK